MKIQCPLCKEIVPIGRFEVKEPGIEVTCAGCSGRFRVAADSGEEADAPASPPAVAPPEPGPDQMRCPKCGRLQPLGDACRYCGLGRDRFDDFAHAVDDEVPDEIAALWQHCRDQWDDDERHERFVQAVSRIEAFPYAARCYRGALDERPDDPRAKRQLERVSRMAEALLVSRVAVKAELAAGEREPYRNVIIFLMVLLVIAGVAGMFVLLKGTSSDQTPQRMTVPPSYRHAPAHQRRPIHNRAPARQPPAPRPEPAPR